jgi:phosphoribosylformylglycinamidine cyclo-ligase
MAFGKLDPKVAESIMKGFGKACRENNIALIGGETAEMPGLYAKEEYDMSGTIVGIIEKAKILNGDKVKADDVLVGFPSTGLHTNGYSLARKVLFEKYSVTDKPDGLENSIGEELLQVHKSYLNLIQTIINKMDVHAFSHITGGGITGNTMRVVPKGLSLNIDWGAWELPPIFKLIQTTGNISDEEMRIAFNIGVGMIAIVDKDDVNKLKAIANELNEDCFVMGKVE